MSETKVILVVEDESDLILGLKDAFEFEQWEVVGVRTGEEGIEKAAEVSPDLVILDLMLPGINGYQVCETLRKRDSSLPILILSARSLESDIIRGLEAGADDYVSKPFSIGELLARVRAMFRRVSASGLRTTTKVLVGESEVDIDSHLATIDGELVQLGFYETAILQLLDERRGEPVSRDEILDTVWGEDANPTNRTVDNFILKLRRKLEQDPANPRHILTVYGQGYKLV
ncbi:MAG: response regulator transcription factor [Deltaproteobacteria bacterium]|nr:response regulator transcription factor [Deltaproteobacteria bacterium]